MFPVAQCCGGKKCDCVDSLVCLLIKVICREINAAGRRRLSFLKGLVLAGEEGFGISHALLADSFKLQRRQESVTYPVKKIST